MIQNSYPTPQRKPISIWCLIVVLRSIKRLCTSIKHWIGKRVIKNQSVKGTQFSCLQIFAEERQDVLECHGDIGLQIVHIKVAGLRDDDHLLVIMGHRLEYLRGGWT